MNRIRLPLWAALLLPGCLIYAYSTFSTHQNPLSIKAWQAPPLGIAMQKLFAGQYLGLAADYNLLRVFSLYDLQPHSDNRATEGQNLWPQIQQHLINATRLDPYFKDSYRLITGLLAFQPKRADLAVKLLEYGSAYRTRDWEIPFVAAFLSHEMLKDDQRAFKLMREAATRPGAPPLAAALAARFLRKNVGLAASIQFLEYLKTILPKNYWPSLQKRIQKLQQEGAERGEKP